MTTKQEAIEKNETQEKQSEEDLRKPFDAKKRFADEGFES